MPNVNPNQNRNVNSGAAPAIAGGQSTGGASPDGPVSRSALSDLIARTMLGDASGTENPTVQNPAEGQPAAEPNTPVTPGPDPGQAEPEPNEADPGANPDELTPPQTEQALNEDPLAESGQAPEEQEQGQEQEQEQEQAEEETPGVQKRIGRLQAKIRELETKLEQNSQTPATPQGPSPLDQVNDLNELDRRADRAEQGLEEAEGLLAKLAIAPQRCEEYLRSAGIKLTDEHGQEDYSPERMADFLTGARQSFRQMLKAVPRRRQWLADHAQAHGLAVKVLPWIKDVADERHAMMSQIIQQFPSLKSQPNWEYWVGCAIEGHQAIMDKSKAQGPKGNGQNAQRFNAQRSTRSSQTTKGMPNSGGGNGSVRVVPRTAETLQRAKAKAMEGGSRKALSVFFQETGILK